MTSQIDNEWTIITPATNTTMDPQAINPTPAPAPAATAEPKIELTINAKPPAPAEKKDNVCTCDNTNPPKLARQESNDSLSDYDTGYRRRRHRGPIPIVRRFTPSPHRNRSPGREKTPMLSSSTQLLSHVGSHDGIADVPFPARSSIYLTTYPFTNRDVKKWAWLIGHGVEETYLEEKTRGRGRGDRYDSDEDEDEDNNRGPLVVGPARRRNHSPIYDASLVDVPSVYLSRALDTSVVPEDTEHNVKYLIVVQHRPRPEGAKLMVADSRKAAAIMIYYEMLTGRSILFVGAMVHQCKKVAKGKICKVDSLDEALKVQEQGGVGVIC